MVADCNDLHTMEDLPECMCQTEGGGGVGGQMICRPAANLHKLMQ